MNEENKIKSVVDGCSGSFIDNMGGSSIGHVIVTSSGSHSEKRTLPLLYVQSPISKTLNSSEFKSKVLPAPTVSNGVNGGKIQAFVGTLINKKCQQKVLLTPVKPGHEKKTGMARLLLQGQRSGSLGQVARIAPAPGSQTSSSSTSPAMNVVLPAQGKPICTSYVVGSVSTSTSSSTTNSICTSTISISGTTSGPLPGGNRQTLSIRNAVIIDQTGNNAQTKTAQPNIIRQKFGSDGRITVSSLLKPSGLTGNSFLSKVLGTPSQVSTKIAIAPSNLQLRSDIKKEDSKDNLVTNNEVVLIEDDDDDSITDKAVTNSTSKENSSTIQINVAHSSNGVKESNSESSQEMELTKVPSPILDRARKRKGLLASACEPPAAKMPKQQDKLKLLPGAEEFDPFKVVEWEPSGIGLLPGSNIKMTINELGMLTVAEDTLAERGATPSNPVAEDDEGKSSNKKGNELDSILCCVHCSCYGLPAEFYNPSYCSITCRDAVSAQEEAIVKKIEQEQEQNSDTDQKRKRKPVETVKKNSITENLVINNENKVVDDCEKRKKKGSIKLAELENDSPLEEKKLPTYIDRLIKKYSSADEDYSSTILQEKQLIKKGKILNDMKFPKIKLSKPEVKNAAIENGPSQNVEKNNSIVKPPQVENKQTLLIPQSEVNKGKPIKVTNKSTSLSPQPEINKVKPIKVTNKIDGLKASCKPVLFMGNRIPASEVSQDLDCGKLMPNRVENFKGTCSSSKPFPWASYLNETGSRPAWVKLFNNPFPSCENLFQEGYKLEAIDPEHQSTICVVTVVRICGFRIKLHFDGYDSMFDFWVNADSPNIFPCGFCSRHEIPLSPPMGHSKETFNWLSYNTICMSTAAPHSCFPTYIASSTSPNLFRVGMKLEAVDRKNTFLVCVATVSGIIENRILVHFDSWGDVYDYWVDTCSPYIRPIGWCKENNHELTPPNGIKASEFTWADYLIKTKSEPAPTRAFTLRPHAEFRRGMKLEAIDKRSPHLLRVATIKEVLPYQIKIIFDGFPDQFGYWVDDDSMDIHPIGWAAKTGHPLQPPPINNAPSNCLTPGCLGQGNFKSYFKEIHDTLEECPYNIDHLNSEPLIPDRLANGNNNDGAGSPKPFENEVINLDNELSADESVEDINKKRWKWLGVREGVVNKIREIPKVVETTKKTYPKKMKRRKKKRRSFKINSEQKNININDNNNADDWNNKEPFLSEADPMKWTSKHVIEFTTSVLGSLETIEQIEKEEIDGKGFLMMAKEDLIYYLGFSEETALKLCEKINFLRSKVT